MQHTTHCISVNVKQLRQTAKAQYAQGKGRRDLKGYSRMGKAALLSKLGMHEEARAHKSQATRRKAIAFNATKEGGDSSVKKAQIKGRILRSVKRGIGAEEKKQGRKLTQEEKRTVASRALASEVKAIRSGTPESKPKRGGNHLEAQISNTKASIADVQANIHKAKEISASTGQPFDRYHKAMKGELEQHKASLSKLEKQHLAAINQGLKHGHSIQQIEGGYAMFQGSDRIGNLTAKTPQQVLAKSQKFEQETEGYQSQKKSSFSHSKPPGVSVAEHRANLRRQYGATSGTRNENLSKKEERRSEIGRGDEGESRIRKSEVADRVSEPKTKEKEGVKVFKKPVGRDTLVQKTYIDPKKASDQELIEAHHHSMMANAMIRYGLHPDKSTRTRQVVAQAHGAGEAIRSELKTRGLFDRADNSYRIDFDAINRHQSSKSEAANADRVSEPKGEQGKAANSKELQRMGAERESGKQQGMISANDHQTLFQFKNMGDLDSQATDKVKQTAARVLGVHHSEIKELTRTSVGLNVRLRNESKPSFISESATRPRQIEVRDEKAIKKETKRLLDEAKTVARERIAARKAANLPTPKPNPQYKYEEYTPHEQQLAKIHTRAELEKMHGKLLGAQPGNSASHLRAIEKTTSMQSNSQARAQTGNVVRANYEQRQFYNHALEIHDHYPEKSKQADRVSEPEKAKTRGTKATPWAGNDAPTKTRSGRGEMVRGRSID